MDIGGSGGFAGLPDFCPETCMQPVRPCAPRRRRRSATLCRAATLNVWLSCLGLQTENRFEVILGIPKGLRIQMALFPWVSDSRYYRVL
jgi:hypothetical protein